MNFAPCCTGTAPNATAAPSLRLAASKESPRSPKRCLDALLYNFSLKQVSALRCRRLFLHATGARCFIGLNGNKVQNLGCPRNGKQIKPLHGFCACRSPSLVFYVASSTRRATTPGRRSDMPCAICQPGYRPVERLPPGPSSGGRHVQRASAGSSVTATGCEARPPPDLVTSMQTVCLG